MLPWTSFHASIDVASQSSTSTREGAQRAPGHLPPPRLPDSPVPGVGSSASGGGTALILFAVLLASFLLVIPNAVRRLRAAPALGLSPVYVAPGDRPG
jgi:hypothetical protein